MILLADTGQILLGAGSLAVALVVGVATVVLGVPAWRNARTQNQRDRTQELAESMARYFGIPIPDHPSQPIPAPSKDHPTIIDLLTEMRDNSQETAATSAVVAHHVADGHGGKIPPDVLSRLIR